MKQIKSLYRRLLLPLLGGLALTACEKDNGEETRVSEFGPYKKEIIAPWKGGTGSIPVLANQPYDIELINPDNGWLTLDTEGRGTHFTGDDYFKFQATTNDGFPRMEGIRLWTHNRADTVYIKQEGFITPKLDFSTRSIMVLGDGGQATAQLSTNLELEDLRQSIVYTSADEGGWISDLDISNGFLILQTDPNADPEALRNARITLSYRDGWNRTISSTVYLTQANAKNEFGHEISFSEVRDLVGIVNKDVYIEGRIISDIGNGNNGENMMTGQTSIDYTETYRTAYIQSLDGSQGFMIKTVTEDDNIFERYSKVRILLKGVTVEAESNPERYILKKVTSAMVMSSVSGSAADIPQKVKRYNELTDMDVYTWVTLADCELPVRKGSLTPINEGYARSTNANRETKYPMLVRDKNGDSFYMLTNTTCKYRRDGSMLPYGSGNISGVLVHETHDRFVWMGSKDMGDIGRYQIRHLTREDIALEKDFENSFSALLTEYRYGKLESHIFRPTTGDNGYLTFTHPDEKSGDAGWGVSDPSYLGPIGNESNPDKEKPWGGTNKGNINGNGVVENGKQMCSDPGTNNDGKGNLTSAEFSAWTNKCQWWNTETDRSEAWLLHFSTQGISTDVLSMQVAMQNRSIGGPRYIRVDWSEHGDNNRDDWNPITEFQVPDIVNWNYTLYWQCAGYKYINVPLPLELLGKDDVCIRFSAANKKAGGKEDGEFDDQIITTGEIAFSYIGVRYTKYPYPEAPRLQTFCRRGFPNRSTRIQTVKHLLFLIFAVQACLPGFAACDGRVRIVPRPAEVEELPGSFRLTSRTPVVITDERLRTPAEIFARAVGKLTGAEPAVTAASEKHAVTLQLQPGYEAEEYLLEVGRQRITVTASTPQAVLHGLRSLQQLVAGGEIPACVVRDKPTFAYRGAMLDVCRHFFPVEDVKTYIDILSLHKINKFHWHLTDDQGWRIEIKKYPLLTQIGSRRAETLVGRYDKNKEGVYDGKPYGGFYTQEEIREIVSYAAERHIEVIPEIEMPGHGLAALTAYPWLGCTGGPYAVWTHWGISDDVYCAGKETTFEFIEKVLTEVLALFPSKLIHIGGDECPKGRWKACPLCQQRIREEGLKDEYQLQSYFIHRIERWMHAHGREIIGWDEILQGGISKTANIMSWNGSDPGIKAAQRGNPVIMTPKWYCYFDYSQTSDPERYEPLGNTRYVSVRQAYRLDPCDRLTLPDQKRIRGVQCNLWTEYIADIRHAQHMVLPRMAALAETGWANDRKDYNDFVRRIPALVAVYKAEGYNYAPYLFEGIE